MAPAVITVTTTADDFSPLDGSVSLREAINAIDAGFAADLDITNQSPGPFGTNDTINFNIPGAGVRTITLASSLSDIFKPMTIDGYSQPGASANTLANGDDAKILIELDATGHGGLKVLSSSTIRGLAIVNAAGAGIELDSDANIITGNFIGLRADGTTVAANGSDGVFIDGSSNNRIGGTTPAERNVISGNLGDGINIHAHITVNPSGSLVQGNFIGTDHTGTLQRGNAIGVLSFGAHVTTVGGTAAGSGNVISGNGVGVEFEFFANHVLQGNLIGTDASGTMPLGNTNAGVEISGAAESLIGGTTSSAANTIAFNGGAGITFPFLGHDDAIRQNAVFHNGGLGIDLNNTDVPLPNDSGDSDNGANGLQNFPVLASAASSGGSTTITGVINTNANTALVIDFYANAALGLDSSGFGQGQTYLGSAGVVTDGAGNATFSASFPVAVPVGQFISSTATTIASAPYGNTSEFSQDIQVTGPANRLPLINNQSFATNDNSANGTAVGTVIASDADAGQTLTYAILSGNTGGAFLINPSSGQIRVANSAALAGTPAFSLSVQVTDNGSPPLASSATVTINVTHVAVAPVNHVPPTQQVQKNKTLTLSGANAITVSDPDAGASLIQVTLTVYHGTLSLGSTAGLTFLVGDGKDDATMTFKGSLAAINTALGGLKYAPTKGYSGSDTLTITSKDLGTLLSDTDMVTILVK